MSQKGDISSNNLVLNSFYTVTNFFCMLLEANIFSRISNIRRVYTLFWEIWLFFTIFIFQPVYILWLTNVVLVFTLSIQKMKAEFWFMVLILGPGLPILSLSSLQIVNKREKIILETGYCFVLCYGSVVVVEQLKCWA